MSANEMSSDDDDVVAKEKPSLNMEHGFLYHIRRNQYDRDNYDKKLKKEKLNRKNPTHKNYKPENKHYQPPSKRVPDDETDIGDTDLGKGLYILEYTSNNGKLHSVMIRENQDPHRLAKRLANSAGIPQDLIETLEWKIEQEQLKRRK